MTSAPPSIPASKMPAPFVGTPYKNEDGVFEYPFPTPPLPTPPYQPSSAPTSPANSVISAVIAASGGISRPDSPSSKLSSKLVKDGPVPPGLANFGARRESGGSASKS